MLVLEKAIKDYCNRQEINIEQFADSIGVTYRAVNYYMKGLKNPSAVTLKRISILTGVSMDELTKDIK